MGNERNDINNRLRPDGYEPHNNYYDGVHYTPSRQRTEYDSRNGFDPGSGLDPRSGYVSRSGFDSRSGAASKSGFDSRSGAASKSGFDSRSEFDSRNRFDSKSGYDYVHKPPKTSEPDYHILKRLPANKQKSQYAIFFISTVFVGVITCLVAFAIVFNSISSSKNNNSNLMSANTLNPLKNDAAEITIPQRHSDANVSVSAIITDISKAEKQVSLYDINGDGHYVTNVGKDTALKDKYGTPIDLGEFKNGDIVEAAIGEADLLNSLQLSINSWKFESTSVIVDTTAKTIKISSATYKYTDNLLVEYKNNPFDIANIDPIDTVTVRGQKDTALYVEVEKSHGLIISDGQTEIKNGSVEIDTDIFRALGKPFELKVTEGPHKIVIKGDNIETYSKEIFLEPGDIYDLETPEITIKTGYLSFNVNEEDATLTINDIEMSYDKPVELEYGDYFVKIVKDGFTKWEEKITLDKPSYIVSASLESLVKVGKLEITTDPDKSYVYLDNIFMGMSPLTVSVEYGLRVITVKKAGYEDYYLSLYVSEEFTPVPITLVPAMIRDSFDYYFYPTETPLIDTPESFSEYEHGLGEEPSEGPAVQAPETRHEIRSETKAIPRPKNKPEPTAIPTPYIPDAAPMLSDPPEN